MMLGKMEIAGIGAGMLCGVLVYCINPLHYQGFKRLGIALLMVLAGGVFFTLVMYLSMAAVFYILYLMLG
jgi:hypothetical protein